MGCDMGTAVIEVRDELSEEEAENAGWGLTDYRPVL